MTDTTDVVVLRRNADPFCKGGEQRLLGVIHKSRVCVKMTRKSSYPIVVVGNFFKIRIGRGTTTRADVSVCFPIHL